MSDIVTKAIDLISRDIPYLLLIFIILFIYALYFGRNWIVAFILAFYPATFLYNLFPFTTKFTILSGDKLLVLNKVLIFLIFFISLNFIIKKFINSYEDEESSKIYRSVGLALIALIMFILFSYNTINLDTIHNLSNRIDNLFLGENKVFWWNLGSLVLLGLI